MVLGPTHVAADQASQGQEPLGLKANMSNENLRIDGQNRGGPISVRHESNKQALAAEPNSAAAVAERKQEYGIGNQNYLTGNFGALKLQK